MGSRPWPLWVVFFCHEDRLFLWVEWKGFCMRVSGFLASVFSFLALATSPGAAQDPGRNVQLHAYGGWALGNSDPHPFLFGRGDGENEWENANIALNVSADLARRVHVAAQVEWLQESDETEQELDFVFATLDLGGARRLMVGLAKQPFGLYTEIFDVGTLRPFFSLPQSLYGAVGTLTERYAGVGYSWRAQPSEGWELDLDLYAGGLETDVTTVASLESEGEDGEEEEEEITEHVENVLGGRVTVVTPIEGLSFGLSAYQGEPETEEEPAPSWGDHSAYGLHVEYLAGAWGVRSEWARHEEEGELEHDARYLEVSYRLAEHWQIAGRFDQADLSVEEELDLPDSFLEHREIGFGLNYLYSDDLVIRLSYHHVEGNLFARPEGEELAEILAGEPVDETTRYLVLGAQFSF